MSILNTLQSGYFENGITRWFGCLRKIGRSDLLFIDNIEHTHEVEQCKGESKRIRSLSFCRQVVVYPRIISSKSANPASCRRVGAFYHMTSLTSVCVCNKYIKELKFYCKLKNIICAVEFWFSLSDQLNSSFWS